MQSMKEKRCPAAQTWLRTLKICQIRSHKVAYLHHLRVLTDFPSKFVFFPMHQMCVLLNLGSSFM